MKIRPEARSIQYKSISNLSKAFIICELFIDYIYEMFYIYKMCDKTRNIVYPPGMYISIILGFLFSKKMKERVFDPMLSDMQEEYFEALDKELKWKVHWIYIRGIASILVALISQLSISIVKIFIEIWKIS